MRKRVRTLRDVREAYNDPAFQEALARFQKSTQANAQYTMPVIDDMRAGMREFVYEYDTGVLDILHNAGHSRPTDEQINAVQRYLLLYSEIDRGYVKGNDPEMREFKELRVKYRGLLERCGILW